METTDEINIKREVRHGCVISPYLFNMFSEDIIKRAVEDENSGIKINETPVITNRHADDIVVKAECIVDLQRLMDIVVVCSEDYGLTLNIKKRNS